MSSAKIIELRIDKPKAEVNGETKWIDLNNHEVKPIIMNGRTMLPLRFVAENLGCKVGWDPNTRTITITYEGVSSPGSYSSSPVNLGNPLNSPFHSNSYSPFH